MMDYRDMTIWQLQQERDKIEAELKKRLSVPFGAGTLVDPAVYGCCGRMPCQRTACPAPFVVGELSGDHGE